MKEAEAQRLFELTAIEREFWQQPDVILAGMDEVGRGPLAGPVVTACVVLPPEPLVAYVKDSKKLSEKRRELVYEEILKIASDYACGWIWPQEIDAINILQATRKAMCMAYEGLKMPATDVLIDAVKDLPLKARQHSFIKGDALSYLIGAASILAKVQRDRYMIEQDAIYPQYGFARNKGYGTAEHIAALREYGPCPLHRRSFIGKLL